MSKGTHNWIVIASTYYVTQMTLMPAIYEHDYQVSVMVLNFMLLPCIDDILLDAWFLKIDFIYKAGMHVCVCTYVCVCVAFTSKAINK